MLADNQMLLVGSTFTLLLPSNENAAARIKVTGTFVGTLNIQGSLDGITFGDVLSLTPMGGGAVVTALTAPGNWKLSLTGYKAIKCVWAAFTSSVDARVLISVVEGSFDLGG